MKYEKRDERSKCLLLSLGINIIILFFYIYFVGPFNETNDDMGMALICGGAYGEYSPYLIFVNWILGVIICTLTKLFPALNWYYIVQYIMIYLAFCALSYVMLRRQGKKTGLLSSLFFSIVLGYQCYIVFQFTRTATIATIGGLILLFYAIDFANDRKEIAVAVVLGGILVIFGSMLRFLMFAVATLIIAGVALYDIIFIIKHDKKELLQALKKYAIGFGIVFMVALGLKGIDEIPYKSDMQWKEYTEFNSLRSELYDFGFPSYSSNEQLYQSLGISEDDFEYLISWNMDTDVLDISAMKQLIDAKPKRNISWSIVKDFFRDNILNTLSISIFSYFLIMVIINAVFNVKSLVVIVYDFLIITALELYLYLMNRYGLSRIDVSMWMAAIVSLVYILPKNKITFCSKKEIGVGIGILLALNLAIVNQVFLPKTSNVNKRNFFNMITEDEKNLYVFTMNSGPYRLSTSYDFGQTILLGDARNIYHCGGWELNMPTINRILERYEVQNVFRDCVDNENCLILAEQDLMETQSYIRENYDSNAGLYLVKDIDGQKMYQARSKQFLENLVQQTNTELQDIQHDINLSVQDNIVSVTGYVYKEESNSFQQRTYLKISNANGYIYYDLIQSNNENLTDINNGKYSKVSGSFFVSDIEECTISVILYAEGEYYEIKFDITMN